MKPLIILLVGMYAFPSLSQPVGCELKPFTLPYGRVIDWHSKIVSDSFRTYIFVPEGYDTSTKRYPVLYLTDGDWIFTAAINAFGGLKQDYFFDEPVIVAIGYGDRPNMRSRDLDPEKGGGAFLQALKHELMPWVKQQFRVNENQSLYGYSMGGKFSSFALFNEPELFSSVLIGAPADNGIHLAPTTQKYAGNISKIQAKIFLGAGEYEAETVYNIRKFAEWYRKQKPGAEVITYEAPRMNHGAAISAVLQEALRVSYADWHKAITLPSSTLLQYTGLYRSLEDSTVYNEVIFKNGKLYILLHGYENDYPTELHAVSVTQFFLKEFEKASYTFGPPASLTIRFPNGNVMKMRKSSIRVK